MAEDKPKFYWIKNPPFELDNRKTMLVGVDPGTGSPVTAVCRFANGTEAVFGLSNKEYRHECRFTKHGIWRKHKHKELNLKDWMSTTPSPKVYTVQEFTAYLQHLFEGDFLAKHLALHMSKRARANRLEGYIYKQKTMSAFCKAIIEAEPPIAKPDPKSNNKCKKKTSPADMDVDEPNKPQPPPQPPPKSVFIAFGDASWTRVKGHASAPRGRKFMKALRQYKSPSGRKVYVLQTPEFNTSQVCSACEGNGEHFTMFTKLASKKVANHHYVRKCQLCQTVFKM